MRLYCAENRRAPFVETFQRSGQNHGFEVYLVDPGASPSKGFDRFSSLYKHHSINSAGFELACFKRYFAAQRDMHGHGKFVMADSDIVVQSRWDEMPMTVRDAGDRFVGSVGYSADGPEDDIAPHFSVWNRALLSDFIDFLLEQYLNGADELAQIYQQRLARNPRASVSDMTLLAMWQRKRQVPFSNSNIVVDGQPIIDHNISTPWTANRKLRNALGRKQLRLGPQGWQFRTDDGHALKASVLHLQGRYKQAANAIEHRQPLALLAVSAYIHLGRKIAL